MYDISKKLIFINGVYGGGAGACGRRPPGRRPSAAQFPSRHFLALKTCIFDIFTYMPLTAPAGRARRPRHRWRPSTLNRHTYLHICISAAPAGWRCLARLSAALFSRITVMRSRYLLCIAPARGPRAGRGRPRPPARGPRAGRGGGQGAGHAPKTAENLGFRRAEARPGRIDPAGGGGAGPWRRGTTGTSYREQIFS